MMPDCNERSFALPAAGQIDVWFLAWSSSDPALSAYRMLDRYADGDRPFRVIRCASGRPTIDGRSDLSISLSHSGSLAAFAIGRDCDLGIDLERVRPIVHVDRLARRFFSEDEATAVLRCPETERRDAFFQTWVRKEAYLKGLGGGVPSRLRAFTVLEGADGTLSIPFTRLEPEPASTWSIIDLEAPFGYRGALAANRRIMDVRVRVEESGRT